MKELREYLKEIYPEASDSMVDDYITIIEADEGDKLPLTKEMKEFREANDLYNEYKKKRDDLRLKVIEQKERLGCEFQLMSIKPVTKRFFDAKEFYDWTATLVDAETLDKLTVRTIDKTLFTKLEAEGIIEYDEMPKGLFNPRDEWQIRVTKPKKNEK